MLRLRHRYFPGRFLNFSEAAYCVCDLAHNALQLPFFFFFSFTTGFWTDCLKCFSKRFIKNYQGSVWPRSDSFLGHMKRSFHKKYSWTCYSRRVSHMTRLKHGNQHSQHSKKHKKQPETRKQVSQWMPEDSRLKTKRNRVDK